MSTQKKPPQKTKIAGLVDHGGERKAEITGAVREVPSVDRGRFDLIPPHALLRLAQHFSAGAVKYGDRNWEKGLPLARFVDSLLRHVNSFMDNDTSEDHMAAILWNAAAYVHTEREIRAGRLPKELACSAPWFHSAPEDPK